MIYDIPTLTSEAIGLLKSLIAIPSLSREEEQAADFLQNYIEMQGMATGRKGNNIWCLSPMFDLQKPTLLLNSHIDTVKPVNGWRKAPFNAVEENGKIYGLGHAVYTMSDPRAVLLKKYARHMAQIKGYEAEFDLLQKVEELGIPLVQERRRDSTPMCANVNKNSGLMYTMLGIPQDVFTPLFASARIAGWCANRMEELQQGLTAKYEEWSELSE